MTVHRHLCEAGTANTVSGTLSWATSYSDHYHSFADGSESTLKDIRSFNPVYVIPQANIDHMQLWSRSREDLTGSVNGEM